MLFDQGRYLLPQPSEYKNLTLEACTRRGYVLESGKIVLAGSSSELMNNDKVKRAYIGA